MLNLLRYDGMDGRGVYGRYAQVAGVSIAAVGGSLMYLGQVIESDAWDTVAIVNYPSLGAFLEMQRDAQYIAAIPDRTAGLHARLLCPFELASTEQSNSVELMTGPDSDVVAVQLVRRHDQRRVLSSDHRQRSTAALQLPAVGSGLVTDGRWDELRVVRYQSHEHCLDDATLWKPADPDMHDLQVVLSRPAVPS